MLLISYLTPLGQSRQACATQTAYITDVSVGKKQLLVCEASGSEKFEVAFNSLSLHSIVKVL